MYHYAGYRCRVVEDSLSEDLLISEIVCLLVEAWIIQASQLFLFAAMVSVMGGVGLPVVFSVMKEVGRLQK